MYYVREIVSVLIIMCEFAVTIAFVCESEISLFSLAKNVKLSYIGKRRYGYSPPVRAPVLLLSKLGFILVLSKTNCICTCIYINIQLIVVLTQALKLDVRNIYT